MVHPLDPGHFPGEIKAIGRIAPDQPQVACYGTAFHHDLPRGEQVVPIPRRYQAMEVCRYGFRGLWYASLIDELSRVAGDDAARGRANLSPRVGGGPDGGARPAERRGRDGFAPPSELAMGMRSDDLDHRLGGLLARTGGMSAFACHGDPWLIHRRANHRSIHVR